MRGPHLPMLVLAAFYGLSSPLALAEPAAEPEAEQATANKPKVSPYAVFVGGAAIELVDRRDDENDQRQGRFWMPALARVGLAGKLSDKFTIQSEVEFNAGPYGTSVWEGQAAMQVRNQLLRYRHEGLLSDTDRFEIEVGRVTDPASVNYVSLHIANLLLSDPIARFPLLTSGFNRGNGGRVAYTLNDKLTFGVTGNAGNPTSTTGTVMLGGTFFPFQRFYEVPWSFVGRDARGFPASNFHMMMISPSVRWKSEHVQAQVAVQSLRIDTNTNTTLDENITGTNLRGGVRITPIKQLAVFGNVSQIVNDVTETDDVTVLADGKYLGITAGGGVDVYLDGVSGFGFQYDRVREEQRGLSPDVRHHFNAGATVFVDDNVFLSGRFAFFQLCQESETLARCDANGLRQIMLTATAVLGPSQDVRP
ncbi:MAG: hypothetical protein AB8H79_19570 [Myxococcota bacterium]